MGKLLVKCEEEPGTHPHCPHGPMLLFYKSSADGYFACSAFREKKVCPYHVNVMEMTEPQRNKRYPVETYIYKELRKKIESIPGESRNFCHDCNQPFVYLDVDHHINHRTIKRITDEMLANPTSFLIPIDNDKVEAQYFFDQNALKFLVSCLKKCNIEKVVCIGAPRLHAYLKANTSSDSYLLDFDHRYFYFYDDDQFAWYNMCNNHFFEKKQRIAFERFLKTGNDNIAIFIDPPFGCRTEVVANSIKQLTNLYRSINMNQIIPAVFWVYPYFCETYIREVMPEMNMSDYKINYTNHDCYSNGTKGRKLGSPVRVFTNVELSAIVLPENEGYRHCKPCERWTAIENLHCNLCNSCPSKNGDSYRHCPLCRVCVKPNYIHCKVCRRCTQKVDHNCTQYQQKIRCWICNEVGHNELRCQAISPSSRTKMNKKSPPICLICRQRAGHNEKYCPKRLKYIQERKKNRNKK